MYYDVSQDSVVVAGGIDYNLDPIYNPVTYQWDGASWSDDSGTPPGPSKFGSSYAITLSTYDPDRGQGVLIAHENADETRISWPYDGGMTARLSGQSSILFNDEADRPLFSFTPDGLLAVGQITGLDGGDLVIRARENRSVILEDSHQNPVLEMPDDWSNGTSLWLTPTDGLWLTPWLGNVTINPDAGNVRLSPANGPVTIAPATMDTEVHLAAGMSLIVLDSVGAPVLEVTDDQSNGNRVNVYDQGGNKIWEIRDDGSLHGKTGQSLVFDL
jgi:hypothetical protein